MTHRVVFNSQSEFVGELEKDRDHVVHGLVRLTFQEEHIMGGLVRRLRVLATCRVRDEVYELVTFVGDLTNGADEVHDKHIKDHGDAVLGEVRLGIESAGLEARAGVISR